MSEKDVPFIWKGRQLKTAGDIMDVAIKIAESKDRAKAVEFFNAYVDNINACNGKPMGDDDGRRIASSNIGYMSGYYGNKEMALIQDIFNVEHPIFGKKQPTAKEAFEMGQNLGKYGPNKA